MSTQSSWDPIIGQLSLVTLAVGLIGNTLLLSYLISCRSWQRASDTLYLLICLVDLLILLFHLPASLSLLAGRQPGALFASTGFCDVWGVVWDTAIRLSVFLIALLSVSRMVILVSPFRRVRRAIVLGLVAGYLAALVLQGTLPFWFGLHYQFTNLTVVCAWPAAQLFKFPSANFTTFYLFAGVLEFLVPLVIISPACLISVVSLYNSSTQHLTGCCHGNTQPGLSGAPEWGRPSSPKNSATITIIVLTVAYLACNAPLVVFVLLNFVELVSLTPTGYRFNFFAWDSHFYLYIVVCISTVLVNAAINPILFCWRVQAVRAWLRGLGHAVRAWLRGLGHALRAWLVRAWLRLGGMIRCCWARRDSTAPLQLETINSPQQITDTR